MALQLLWKSSLWKSAGREIGVPTANIWIPKQKLPISGVYAVRCLVDHAKYLGIANMGIRPTVGGTRPVLETHIFDFEKDIYGRRITVQFIEKIREEVKFDSIDLLKSQIKKILKKQRNLRLKKWKRLQKYLKSAKNRFTYESWFAK